MQSKQRHDMSNYVKQHTIELLERSVMRMRNYLQDYLSAPQHAAPCKKPYEQGETHFATSDGIAVVIKRD